MKTYQDLLDALDRVTDDHKIVREKVRNKSSYASRDQIRVWNVQTKHLLQQRKQLEKQVSLLRPFNTPK